MNREEIIGEINEIENIKFAETRIWIFEKSDKLDEIDREKTPRSPSGMAWATTTDTTGIKVGIRGHYEQFHTPCAMDCFKQWHIIITIQEAEMMIASVRARRQG